MSNHFTMKCTIPDVVREYYFAMDAWLNDQTPENLADKRKQADLMFHKLGIILAVYGEDAGLNVNSF